jgi:hypothetical protein
MAPTVQWVGPVDDPKFREVDVTFDTSYVAGGYLISATQLGMSTVFGVIITSNPSGYVLEWDAVNSKVKVYRVNTTAAALAEVPAATNLSGITARLLVVGKL